MKDALEQEKIDNMVETSQDGFTVMECIQLINHYQEQAEYARNEAKKKREAGPKFDLGQNKTFAQDGSNPASDFYMKQAAMMQDILEKIVAAKAQKSAERIPGIKPVEIVTAKGETAKADVDNKEVVKPIDEKPEGKGEVKADFSDKTSDKVDEMIVDLQLIALEDKERKRIHQLINEKKTGNFLMDGDKFKEASENDMKMPGMVVENRTIPLDPRPVKWSTVEREGELRKDTLLINPETKQPLEVTDADRKNKKLIIDEKYCPSKDIKILRTMHSAEKAVDLVRQHLVGQGVKEENMPKYAVLRTYANGIANEVEREIKEQQRNTLQEKIEALKIKAARKNVSAHVGESLSKLNGVFTKGDEFDMLVLSGDGELDAEDETKLRAIQLAIAGDRKKAVAVLLSFYSDKGITLPMAEAILNKLLGDEPYAEIDNNIREHLMFCQNIAKEKDGRVDGYKDGLTLAKQLMRAFTQVFALDDKGNRTYENGDKTKPIMLRWSDTKIDNHINRILDGLREANLIPEESGAITVDKEELRKKREAAGAGGESKPSPNGNSAEDSKGEAKVPDTKTADATDGDSKGKSKSSGEDQSNEDGQGESKATDKDFQTEAGTSEKQTDSTESSSRSTEEGILVEFHYKKINPNGNSAIVTAPGCEFNMKTKKTGEALYRQIGRSFTDFMNRVIKLELDKEAGKEVTLLTRLEQLKDWKKGDAIRVKTITVSTGKKK